MKKRIVSILLALALLCSLLPASALPVRAATTSGTCGDNLTWSFDSATGTLTIQGSGNMYDFDNYAPAPWDELMDSIKKITIGNSVTSIGNYAFENCTSLTSVTIPNSVTSIGSYAFRYCTSMTSVTIPNSVTSIGSYAFYGCTSLTSVTIPDSVTSIGLQAFDSCDSLTKITVASGNPNYCSDSHGVLFNKNKTKLIRCPGGFQGSYTIPDSVTSIGELAFSGCTALTSVTIPNSVTSISVGTFSDCTSLTSVTIPNSVTSIGDWAFLDCTSLTSVTIPNSVTSIGDWAFLDCTALTSVTIPNSVTSIGGDAFNNCTSLTSVTIPNSVTSIGDDAFYNCTSLTSVTIGSSVTSIGSCAFCDCDSLTKITVASGNPNYCSDSHGVLFNKNKTKLIQCPGGFQGSYTIPSSVTGIGSHAFYNCTSLTSVAIPDSVTSIGARAFKYCGSLTSVAIPNSVTSIGNSAFCGCTSLASIAIMNPACEISQGRDTLGDPDITTIYGCSGSTAEDYANRYGYQFDLISNDTPPAALTDEIIHLLFADLSYVDFEKAYEGSKVSSWIADTLTEIAGNPYALYNKDYKVLYNPIYEGSSVCKLQLYSSIGDWTIVEIVHGKAGFDCTVFKKGNNIVIAYRGTDDPSSVCTDAKFALLNYLEPDQFEAALEVYYRYATQGNVTLTGHSLGGALVTYVSTLTGARGYSYDGACGHVIDLTYLFEPSNIAFHSKNNMPFTNYTDPESETSFLADLIEHTRADLFPGVCYESNSDCIRYYPLLTKSHQIYSNTRLTEDEKTIRFMPVAETHAPKNNWYASVDFEYLGLAIGSIGGGIVGGVSTGGLGCLAGIIKGAKNGSHLGRLTKVGNVILGTSNDDTLTVFGAINSIWDCTAAVTTNVIYGGDGRDSIQGGEGPDILVPGSLDGDLLCGNLGDDDYLLDASKQGTVYIADQSGKDRIVLQNAEALPSSAVHYSGTIDDNQWCIYKVGSDFTIYVLHKAEYWNIGYSINHKFQVVDTNNRRLCTIDSRGTISGNSKSAAAETAEEELPEEESREIHITGNARMDVYRENERIASFQSKDYGLYPESFGTIMISHTDDANYITATIYNSYHVEVVGEETVDVYLVATDPDGFVESVHSAENIHLASGVVTAELEDQLILQNNLEVTTREEQKTVRVQISQTEAEACVGDELTLTAEAVFPDGTATDAIYWISSDPKIVSCEKNEDGTWVLTALDAGETEVYAVAEDSGFSAICNVKTTYRLPCTGGISCPGKGFEDMPPKGNWAHDAIDWAVVSGITKGTSATTFSPGKTCTRCEVVTFLWRANGCPEPTITKNPFKDVKEKDFFYKAVLWAVEQGITKGTSATTFAPKMACTRSQVVTFLWRADGEQEPANTKNPFKDVKQSDFFYKAVLWAVEQGITKGTSATTFSPGKTCTRGEVVTFLYRADS